MVCIFIWDLLFVIFFSGLFLVSFYNLLFSFNEISTIQLEKSRAKTFGEGLSRWIKVMKGTWALAQKTSIKIHKQPSNNIIFVGKRIPGHGPNKLESCTTSPYILHPSPVNIPSFEHILLRFSRNLIQCK